MVSSLYFYGEASFNPLTEVVARRETRSETSSISIERFLQLSLWILLEFELQYKRAQIPR